MARSRRDGLGGSQWSVASSASPQPSPRPSPNVSLSSHYTEPPNVGDARGLETERHGVAQRAQAKAASSRAAGARSRGGAHPEPHRRESLLVQIPRVRGGLGAPAQRADA
ncbi:hypothetical protein MSAN_00327700 [Mycena sanguinolenta]|uniref:Uncharacterized protein n=1 Tax=Mycena sanguinolenta TaxID=230812 RepID=A0A8H6ZDS7_9AGAR|nr:hypothetical protein MSAN_00327700 [Mycena sanguinolenta]